MKRAKRIYVLLGVLAVVCVAAFTVVHYQEEQERIANTDEVILEVDPDAVESLSWSYDDQSLAFHKDEHWIYDEDEAFPVDEEKINALLSSFSPSAPPSSSRTSPTSASTAWTTRCAPSTSPPPTPAMRSSWAISAPWMPSAMSPSETGTSTWSRTTLWTPLR